MSKTISKRGIVVDFDILRMKQEMMSAIPDTVLLSVVNQLRILF